MKIFDFKKLSDTLVALIETKVELIKLDIRDETIKFASKAFVGFGLVALLGVVIVFLSFAMAFLLNELMDSSYQGFLLVAVLYLLIFIMFIVFKKPIEKKIFDGLTKLSAEDQINTKDEE